MRVKLNTVLHCWMLLATLRGGSYMHVHVQCMLLVSELHIVHLASMTMGYSFDYAQLQKAG